jgi:hypothetical protein
MADTELLQQVEQRIHRHYGHPVNALHTRSSASPGADPHLDRTLQWHQRLQQAQAMVERCDEAVLAHLAQGETLTPVQSAELAAAADRLTRVLRAREAVAVTTLSVLREPAVPDAGAGPEAPGLGQTPLMEAPAVSRHATPHRPPPPPAPVAPPAPGRSR